MNVNLTNIDKLGKFNRILFLKISNLSFNAIYIVISLIEL